MKFFLALLGPRCSSARRPSCRSRWATHRATKTPGAFKFVFRKTGSAARNGEILRRPPKLRNVEKWKLVQNDTAIVIKSRSDPHGPAAIELFDVDTGELKESVMTYGIAAGRRHGQEGLRIGELL
jgi:hypothetical protein